MVDDPIIRELHEVKDESAARSGNDVRHVARAIERHLKGRIMNMEPNADPFWLENVESARNMRPEDKLTDGADLFDYACEITLSGIKWQNPGVSDEKALQILRDRLAMVARREAAL